MPRPRTPALRAAQLFAHLGAPAHERADFRHPENGAPGAQREKMHRGWLWRCGCAAFVRPLENDAYLYVPCGRHRAPAEAPAPRRQLR